VHGTSAYVTTKRYQNSQYQYLSLRIRPFEHHSDWQLDSVGNPFYATNELIVKFDEQAIDSSAVDDVLASRKVVSWYDTTAYRVTPYQITTTVQHALPGTDSLLHAWPRPSRSSLFPLPDAGGTLLPREKCTLTTYNQSSATLTGYVYQVSTLSGTPLGWIPFDTSAVHTQVAYTLLTHDSLATGRVEAHETRRLSATLFPNPTGGEQVLQIASPTTVPATVWLYDLAGKPITHCWEGVLLPGPQQISLNHQALPPGMYFCQVHTPNKILSLKLIKN
jgi:hypothetical protein